MKILITGIHGFVGGNLVKALGQSNEIYGLDIVAPEKEGVVKTFSWDDLDENKIPQVDAVIHLAGKAHDLEENFWAGSVFKVIRGSLKRCMTGFLNHRPGSSFLSSVKAAVTLSPVIF